jgi:hypothetical protein
MTSIEQNSDIQEQLAKIFDISATELNRKAYIVLIDNKLSQIEAMIYKILNRHGIKDLQQFDEFFQKGKIAESDGWEDFFELDGLISEKNILEDIKKKLVQ